MKRKGSRSEILENFALESKLEMGWNAEGQEKGWNGFVHDS